MFYCEIVTAAEAFELSIKGGATDFARVISACESLGPYCLIGGLAVNCFVEPVYTLDADLVLVSESLASVSAYLKCDGFLLESYPNSLNAKRPGSELRVQFTTDPRYQIFLARAEDREVLGLRVKVACLEDVVRGKMWAYSDPERRLSKRKKDELDLIRLGEAYPSLRALYPPELSRQLGET